MKASEERLRLIGGQRSGEYVVVTKGLPSLTTNDDLYERRTHGRLGKAGVVVREFYFVLKRLTDEEASIELDKVLRRERAA